MVKIKEKCFIKNEDGKHKYEGTGAQNTLCAPAIFIRIQYGNLMKNKTTFLYEYPSGD